jgi:hypothetical protein
MHYGFGKNASVFFSVRSYINGQKSIVSVFSHGSDLFGWEDDINLFLASLRDFRGMSFDDRDAFPLIFEWYYSIGKFSGLTPEDNFVMVEDTLFEEHPSDGSDVNLCSVFDVRMKDEFGCAKIELQNISELHGLEEGFGQVFYQHNDYVI